MPNTALYGHSLIINPSLRMYQEIPPCRGSSIGSVKINTSLPMMRECIVLDKVYCTALGKVSERSSLPDVEHPLLYYHWSTSRCKTIYPISNSSFFQRLLKDIHICMSRGRIWMINIDGSVEKRSPLSAIEHPLLYDQHGKTFHETRRKGLAKVLEKRSTLSTAEHQRQKLIREGDRRKKLS